MAIEFYNVKKRKKVSIGENQIEKVCSGVLEC